MGSQEGEGQSMHSRSERRGEGLVGVVAAPWALLRHSSRLP